MISKKRLLLVACSALFVSGCAIQTTPPDANNLDAIATQVISEAVYHSTLFSTCITLGGDTELDAIDIQQDWLNENSTLVAAADNYYSQQQAENTFSYDGKTLAPTAIRLALDARARANDELALAQRSPANKQKTCQFRLAQISGEKLSLANMPAIAPYQAELLKHLPLDLYIADIPRLAGGLAGVSPGVSYFTVVKDHENNCQGAYTLSITNQWPNEVYANFCGEKAIEVLTCEWGKCASKKL